MRISEYIQIVSVIIGLGLITWVKMAYTRRVGAPRSFEPYSKQELLARSTRTGPRQTGLYLFYLALFVLCTAYLIHDTYNPFLYFRF